ncbi:unnamed protein product, partial [Tetraodon nigroviridis]
WCVPGWKLACFKSSQRAAVPAATHRRASRPASRDRAPNGSPRPGHRCEKSSVTRGEDVVLRGRSCDSALRPEGRQSCQIQRCPPEPTGRLTNRQHLIPHASAHTPSGSPCLSVCVCVCVCVRAPAASSAASAPLEDSCRDKPTANCALVLKVKLCSHWYYRRACCHACQAARP